ncbi:MAG: SGNH/GDSL hydrolase family protein [Myxococcota bacterium]
MAQALGFPLARRLRYAGLSAHVKAQAATYLHSWLKPEMGLREELFFRKPALVIVSLGGNETRIPDPTDRIPRIRRIVELISRRSACLWIGIPLWPGHRETGISRVIAENVAPCHYVPTSELIELARGADGIHPTPAERDRWADLMLQWLRANRIAGPGWRFRVPYARPTADPTRPWVVSYKPRSAGPGEDAELSPRDASASRQQRKPTE